VRNGDSVGRATGIRFSVQTIVEQDGKEISDGIKGVTLKKFIHSCKFVLEDIRCGSCGSTQTWLNMRKIGSWRDRDDGHWNPA
jgi:hypothetical protein